jgi:hypothetical protein
MSTSEMLSRTPTIPIQDASKLSQYWHNFCCAACIFCRRFLIKEFGENVESPVQASEPGAVGNSNACLDAQGDASDVQLSISCEMQEKHAEKVGATAAGAFSYTFIARMGQGSYLDWATLIVGCRPGESPSVADPGKRVG